jgi:hypothetical protein
METEDRPSKHCSLDTQVNLSRVLGRRGIEHLPFDADRTYVIFEQAVLKVLVTEGDLTEAAAFDIECWDAKVGHPDTVLTSFRDTVVAATNNDRRR